MKRVTTKIMSLMIGYMISAAPTHAHEPTIGSIHGTGIELKVGDHAIAGLINNAIVFGDKSATGSSLTFKENGQLVQSSFKKEGATFAGTIRSENEGISKETRLEFVGIDQAKRSISMKANGVPFTVSISAERFENNHFINPTYSTEVNGKKIEFTMAGAQACYGFSTHLIYMIVGTYLHSLH